MKHVMVTVYMDYVPICTITEFLCVESHRPIALDQGVRDSVVKGWVVAWEGRSPGRAGLSRKLLVHGPACAEQSFDLSSHNKGSRQEIGCSTLKAGETLERRIGMGSQSTSSWRPL